MKIKHYRRTYPYICAGCHQKRFSMIYERRIGELCSKCRKNSPTPGQTNIFQGLTLPEATKKSMKMIEENNKKVIEVMTIPKKNSGPLMVTEVIN